MHSYLVRIELQNSSLLDYPSLHKEMKRVGFNTTIKAIDGVEYHLPNAEYVISTVSPIANVLSLAKGCANSTGKTSTVFVVEFSQWTSSGMIPIKTLNGILGKL